MAEKVSIVIPNWNGVHWLGPCLDSLAAQSFLDFRIYVVDNGSQDGSVALLRADYPHVIVIENAENLGFAGGVNCGFRAAEGDLIVALNNDVEVHPDWLKVMVAGMDAHPEAGSGASQLMDFKDREVVDSLGDGLLPIGVSFKAGSGVRFAPQDHTITPIQSPCAAASVYRRNMLKAIGLFDEDFFAYMEDIDLGLRAGAAGYGCIFIPGAIVYHIGSATSGGTASALSMQNTIRNTYAVIIKNVPLPLVPVYVVSTLLFHMLALLGSLFSKKFEIIFRHRKAVMKGLWLALVECPKSMKKRWEFRCQREQSAAQFVSITRATWRLTASKTPKGA